VPLDSSGVPSRDAGGEEGSFSGRLGEPNAVALSFLCSPTGKLESFIQESRRRVSICSLRKVGESKGTKIVPKVNRKADSVTPESFLLMTLGIGALGSRVHISSIEDLDKLEPDGKSPNLNGEPVATTTIINKSFRLEFHQKTFRFIFTYSGEFTTRASNLGIKKTIVEDISPLNFILDVVNQYKDLLSADAKLERLGHGIQNLLMKENRAWDFYFDKASKLHTVPVFEKKMMEVLLGYAAGNNLFQWLKVINREYYEANPSHGIEELDYIKISKQHTNTLDNFIKTIEALNNTRLNI
jgi:hypothetical protein